MKRISLPLLAILLVALTMSLQSCAKEDDVLTEFIADDTTFADFTTWTLKATHNGVDAALNGAHGGSDANSERTIYFKENASRVDGEFPIGTVISKLTHITSTGSEVRTGMVKRGNDFDAANGDWEYFTLAADGAIGQRGTALFGGACVSCHNAVKSNDYIFTN